MMKRKVMPQLGVLMILAKCRMNGVLGLQLRPGIYFNNNITSHPKGIGWIMPNVDC